MWNDLSITFWLKLELKSKVFAYSFVKPAPVLHKKHSYPCSVSIAAIIRLFEFKSLPISHGTRILIWKCSVSSQAAVTRCCFHFLKVVRKSFMFLSLFFDFHYAFLNVLSKLGIVVKEINFPNRSKSFPSIVAAIEKRNKLKILVLMRLKLYLSI